MSIEEQRDVKDENSLALNEETMMERGRFMANGHTFIVRPIYLMEEDEFISDMKVSPVPQISEEEEGHEFTEKELNRWIIALFSQTLNGKPEKKRGKIASFFFWLFHKNDYHYYDNAPLIQPYVKWIERKVTYNGKKIRFYDLERKFWLTKAEIEKLFIFLYEISGF